MAELIVVGAGAAGLMAAGAACRLGHHVTVLEHSDAPGKKILVTGKGRCNVTNNCDEAAFLQNVRTNPRFLYSAIHAFPPAATMALFEELGVPLKTERGRRVFPASDKAQDIRAALLRYAADADLVMDGAKSLVMENGRCAGVATKGGRRLLADGVLVATGGVSYPGTGSTGDGYKLAKQAGHTIVDPVPSLCSLVSSDPACKRMMGLSLRNVTLTLERDGKPVFSELGEMLFTHFGISGPLTLTASSYIRELEKHRWTAAIDLKPALDEDQLYARVCRDFQLLGAKSAQGALAKLLPASMQPVMAERWGAHQRPGRPGPRGDHQRRGERERGGPPHHGLQTLPRPRFRRRGAGPGRLHRGLQFADRFLHRSGGGAGALKKAADAARSNTKEHRKR